jgi:phosphatidylserine/phosphatidylglycerophosphate/cardiolipin synthase-like enzyme
MKAIMNNNPNTTAAPTNSSIETYFLTAGSQTADDVANRIAAFISQAKETIEIAIYSFSLCPEQRSIIVNALQERANAGVKIRIVYDAGSQQPLIAGYSDPCDLTTPQFVSALGFTSRAIEGYRALMHHKYIVLDSGTPQAQVWTGSTNFTDESWSDEENNIIIFQSPELARYYTLDFEELWVDANISAPVHMDSGEATLMYDGKPAYVLVNFSPGEGDWIDESIANAISRAKERITIAAVVITSTRIINALQDAMQRGVPIEGIYDWTQMEGVKYQWQLVPANTWKIEAFARIVKYGNLVGKKSTPYTPTSKHDYMHNKVMVLDDAVLTGSYNFSRHAQQNAENALIIESAALASTYRDYIHSITAKYAPQTPTFTTQPTKTPLTPGTPEATE